MGPSPPPPPSHTIHRGRKEGRQLSCKGQWRLPPSTKREPRSPFFLLLSLRAYLTHSLLLLPPSSFRSLNGNDTPPFSSSFLASQFAFPGKDFFGPPRGKRGRFKKKQNGEFSFFLFFSDLFYSFPSPPLKERSLQTKDTSFLLFSSFLFLGSSILLLEKTSLHCSIVCA